MSTSYLPPLDQLLALGRPKMGSREPWPDYLGMGFTGEHVPELVRMATDAELVEGDAESAPTYGGIHAWRTLGLLRAEAAVEPLIELLETDDDWALDEVPDVLGMIGPAALEPLRGALAKWSLAEDSRAARAAAAAVAEIVECFPEARDAAVAALSRQLRWWARHDPSLNTMLVHYLVVLKAVEAAPLIEEAFAAGAVEVWWFDDDWEDVQVALGLLPERITPRPAYVPRQARSTPAIRIVPPAATAGPKRGGDHKARRKAEKVARQRNRKRR
jgi:hypothetical protein